MRYTHFIPVPPGCFAVYRDEGTASGLWKEPLLAIAIGTYDGEADEFFPITLGVEGPADDHADMGNFLGFEWEPHKRTDGEWLALGK